MRQDRVKALRTRLVREGKTIKQLSEERGLDYRAVLHILNGFHKGKYGKAHSTAVALGLK